MIVKSVPNVRNKINYNYKRNYTECHTVKPLRQAAGRFTLNGDPLTFL